MKSFWTKSALATAALLCVGAANAYVIDFEGALDYSQTSGGLLLVDGDVMTQGNYFINMQDPNNPTYAGVFSPNGGLVGQLSNGSDPSSCAYLTCPAGNTTNFLNSLNDGVVHIGRQDRGNTVFGGLSAAYVATPGNTAGSTVYLAVEADRADGSYASFYYPMPSNGSFLNIGATGGTQLGGTGTLTSGNVTDLFIYAYYCDASSGNCNAFSTNHGEFALDNIKMDVSAVPEPSAWLLMAGGLGALGAIARRRRAA